jgi:LAO/AO transport system kinase
MLVCEAAGFDVIIIETVGVGQSEIAAAGMTDVFVVLQLPNAGDDLQAIKKGILELADMVVYNKADIDARAADLACGQMRSALHMLRPVSKHWSVPVLQTSALSRIGIKAVWDTVLAHQAKMRELGEFEAKRQRQALGWMWALVEQGLKTEFQGNVAVAQALDSTLKRVASGSMSPTAAASYLLDCMKTK